MCAVPGNGVAAVPLCSGEMFHRTGRNADICEPGEGARRVSVLAGPVEGAAFFPNLDPCLKKRNESVAREHREIRPTQNGVGRHDAGDGPEAARAQDLAFHGQAAPLIVGQARPLGTIRCA
jgi:hypothetical protein